MEGRCAAGGVREGDLKRGGALGGWQPPLPCHTASRPEDHKKKSFGKRDKYLHWTTCEEKFVSRILVSLWSRTGGTASRHTSVGCISRRIEVSLHGRGCIDHHDRWQRRGAAVAAQQCAANQGRGEDVDKSRKHRRGSPAFALDVGTSN